MNTFTVHEPPDPPADRLDRAETLAFVKDGFSWSAAIFGPLWLLVKGLWLALLVYLVVVLVLGILLAALGASDKTTVLASLGLHVFLGFEADTLQRWTLSRRDWRTLGIVSGRSREECERRFFDGWLPGQPMVAASFASAGPRPGTLAAAGGDLAMAAWPPAASAVSANHAAERTGWRRLLGRKS